MLELTGAALDAPSLAAPPAVLDEPEGATVDLLPPVGGGPFGGPPGLPPVGGGPRGGPPTLYVFYLLTKI